MIRRSQPLKRSTKPIPRKRKKARRGPMRDPGYLRFLRAQLCQISYQWIENRYCETPRPVQAAHGPVNGMGSKGPDSEAIALCPAHHTEQHRIGWRAFERKYYFSRAEKARLWYAAYLKSKRRK